MDPIDLEGVPRELGFAQGRAARAELQAICGPRDVLARALDGLGHMDAGSARWWRDLRRHFPHQAEWLEGAARGAGLPLPALARNARASLAAPQHALVALEDGEARLVCATPARASLRRVAPEGRFRSLELALPELPTPWLGVNAAGLAVAATPGALGVGTCAAPAAHFARDCLERFESVASALAWCLGRPAAPGAALLLADASGEIAGVELTAQGRRVRRPERGVLAFGVDPALATALEKEPGAACADPRARALSYRGVTLSFEEPPSQSATASSGSRVTAK
ncbi:MAG TPA: hypothetical protein VNF72_12875 [Myxococcota bacterium]|nr:hypothetical protein [Myxococcota bacterium]